MAQPFLFQAADSDGRLVADRVEATDLNQAKHALETRGYRDIVFLTDENQADYTRVALAGTGAAPVEPEFWTPRDEVASTMRKGIGAHLWWAAKQHVGPVGLLAIWNYSSWAGERPFGWGDWLGFAATPLYAVYFFKLSLPFMLFEKILQASVWHDWRDLRRFIALARALRRVAITGIPESELSFREAGALAAQGDLPAALATVERWRDDPAMPKHLFLTREAGLHEHAGDYATMVARLDEAAAITPTGVTHWIDCAAGRIRRLRDVAGAEAALAEIGDAELAALPCAFKNYVAGVIAVERGDDAQAVAVLTGAIDDLSVFGNGLMIEILTEAKGYLLIAEARLGNLTTARARFAEIGALLKIIRANDLYPRCAASVAP